ncbi:pleckstrin homology domain-containing family F member 2-like [Spinachia spinachia]
MASTKKRLMFAQENRQRVQAVENSFGPAGKQLYEPGRLLVGEGRLMKLSRKGLQPRMFFLFNDVLVYGTILVNGRWHKKQKIIPLENIELEDLEDGSSMRNQWLIRTPRKSFYVAAPSQEEKRAWMQHIEDCRSALPQNGGCQTGSDFANTWIPNYASAVCMRCSGRFSVTQRRHHCRKCGFVVCAACSKTRAVIQHIHPTKCLRVCTRCHSSSSTRTTGEAQQVCPWNERHEEKKGSDGEDGSSEEDEEEEEAEEQMEDHDSDMWWKPPMEAWSIYENLQPHPMQH